MILSTLEIGNLFDLGGRDSHEFVDVVRDRLVIMEPEDDGVARYSIKGLFSSQVNQAAAIVRAASLD